ncbi:MAG: hypothetical protein ACOX8A_08645 [Thermacetogeniaceae bacterium]
MLAAIGVFVLLLVALFLASVSVFFTGVLDILRLIPGEIPTMIITGCFLFLFFFFMLSKGSIRYLEEISGTLGKIAEGNFDIQIPKR